MKLKKLILVSLLLLAILTIGAVSASDNLTASENVQDSILAVENEDVIADDSIDEVIGDANNQDAALSSDVNVVNDDNDSNDGSVEVEKSPLLSSARDDNLSSSPEDVLGKKVPSYYFEVEDNYYGHYFSFIFDSDFTIDVEFFVDGKKASFMDMREHGIEGYGGYNGYLAVGTHKILIVLKGNEYYYPRNITKTFTIKPAIFYEHNGVSDIWGTSSGKVEYGRGQDNVQLKIPKNAKGSMVVKVDGKVYKTVKQSNGIATVNLDKLPIGKHQIYAYYNGSDYSVIKLNRTIEVFGAFNAYKNNDIINFYDNAVYGNNNRYYGLKLPNDANGTLEVSIDGKIYTKKMVNGSAKIKVPSNLTVGKHSILIKYLSDDGYDIDSHKTSLYVYPKLISVSKMVLFGKNTVSFKASKDFKGTIYVKVSDDEVNTYKASFKNGIATVSLSKITSGKHKLIFRCNATGQIWKLGETTVTVAHGNNPKVIVAPKSIPYMNGAFKAKVVGVNGKPIKNANVVFKVNHKKVATAKTNALGIAMFKMAKLPGEYLLTAQYGKIAIHKHVEVVSMLKVKQVTVKKSAKSFVLMAALKYGKVPLKNKLITFKFNYKYFKVKTNSLGVARVVISNEYYKDLPVGKRLVYQATYIKDKVTMETYLEK